LKKQPVENLMKLMGKNLRRLMVKSFEELLKEEELDEIMP